MTVVPNRKLTWWSLLTVAMAIPIWYAVFLGGVMSRVIDGGIFVSVVGGIRNGLDLYSQVWDNKDPLFFVVMTGADLISPSAVFFMDWLWVPIGALGAWLLARPLMSGDRALLIGMVVAPFLVTGPFYAAGLTSLPGTATALVGLGLLLNRRAVAGGIVLGLLAFLKLVLWPIAFVCRVWLLLIPSLRRAGLRALTSMGVTLAVGTAGLAVVGWLAPYIDALLRNRAYASDVIVYFGFEDSPIGHLRSLVSEWTSASFVAIAAIAMTAVVGALLMALLPSWRMPERTALAGWLVIAVLGTAGILAFTYVWGHHAQAIYLPAVVAIVLVGVMVPPRWFFPGFLATAVVAAWLMSGVGSPAAALDRVQLARASYDAALTSIDDVPTDAKLLGSVPLKEFTYARLGSNDDEGYLASVRDGADLACAQFHLYDFSPPEDFARMLECIQDVDVVLMTDNFVVFGNGGRAASVQPILQYVDYAFDCLRIGDRQLCTRKPG